MSDPVSGPPADDQAARHCGYTVIDSDGEEQPCDHPAFGWRWYQDVRGHGDCLEPACSVHLNEGGERLHAAESRARVLSGLLRGMAHRASRLRRQTNALIDSVAAVRALADDLDPPKCVEHVSFVGKQPDCAACEAWWASTPAREARGMQLRAALDGPAEAPAPGPDPQPVNTDLLDRMRAGVTSREPAECDTCGHLRYSHDPAGVCRAVIRPTWAPDDECFCGRFVPVSGGPAEAAEPAPQTLDDVIQRNLRKVLSIVAAAEAVAPEPAPTACTKGDAILVWSNPPGGKNAKGAVLPAGWVWACSCGESGTGYATEVDADVAADVHEGRMASGSVTTTPTEPDPMRTVALLVAAAGGEIRVAAADLFRDWKVTSEADAYGSVTYRAHLAGVVPALIGTYADPAFVAHQDHKHPVDGCGYCPTEFEEPNDA